MTMRMWNRKTWTHVRQLFGYARFDNETLVDLMNDLYKNEVSQMNNYFLLSEYFTLILIISKTP